MWIPGPDCRPRSLWGRRKLICGRSGAPLIPFVRPCARTARDGSRGKFWQSYTYNADVMNGTAEVRGNAQGPGIYTDSPMRIRVIGEVSIRRWRGRSARLPEWTGSESRRTHSPRAPISRSMPLRRFSVRRTSIISAAHAQCCRWSAALPRPPQLYRHRRAAGCGITRYNSRVLLPLRPDVFGHSAKFRLRM